MFSFLRSNNDIMLGIMGGCYVIEMLQKIRFVAIAMKD